MREIVLKSVRPIAESLRYVIIDGACAKDFCGSHAPGDIVLPRWQDDCIYPWDNSEAADFFLLFNCINFAFWKKEGKKKWGIQYKGKRMDGAYALMGALTRAVEEGLPILDGAFLKQMTPQLLGEILRGDGELVLFQERVDILREVGAALVERHGGKFGKLLKKAEGSASNCARLLVHEFPSFNDTCRVNGMEVKFYKRAQLAPAMIYGRFDGRGPGAFDDIDDLTVFADYKLPQALRALGILKYRDELAGKVDSRTPLAACSREEVEIRATTVWACELLLEEYARGTHRVNSVKVDAFLWLLAHEKTFSARPYHRTETVFY
jgi:hypothetical protein